MKAGDLVREVSIRAIPEDSKYQLGLVLSVVNFPAQEYKNSAQILWADCTTPLWHPQRRLEKVS